LELNVETRPLVPAFRRQSLTDLLEFKDNQVKIQVPGQPNVHEVLPQKKKKKKRGDLVYSSSQGRDYSITVTNTFHGRVVFIVVLFYFVLFCVLS
jgi:hypothetical protein